MTWAVSSLTAGIRRICICIDRTASRDVIALRAAAEDVVLDVESLFAVVLAADG